MAEFRFPFARSAALFASVAWCAFALPAAAGDLPATAEGAATLSGVFKTYFGATPTVTPQGKSYVVSFAFETPSALAGGGGMKFDPIKIDMKLFQQDDGGWRAEMDGLPTIAMNGEIDKGPVHETVNFVGFKQTAVFDPAIAFMRSSEFSADKVVVDATFPNGSENVNVSGVKGTASSSASAGGALAAAVHETFDNVDLKVDIDAKGEAKPGAPSETMALTGKSGPISADVKLDGLKSRQLLDLWAFMTAHPQRADLASNEAAFKALLSAAAAGEPAFSETAESGGGSFSTAKGGVAFDKAAFGAAAAVKGPQSHFEEHVAMSGFSLSEGMVPAAYKPLIPTSFDIGFKLSGFDLSAAIQEAIANIKLAGDGPWIDKDGNEKVGTKLMGAGPLVIDIPTSHILAPVLDLTLDGHAEYSVGGKPVGKATIRMRNFDKTVSSLKSLGADAEQKLVPVLAMAKGLGKADGDALVWVCEIGADRIIKINGLPLGKAPI
jgi:hypothetical protein